MTQDSENLFLDEIALLNGQIGPGILGRADPGMEHVLDAPMNIVVDDRERDSGVIEHLRNKADFQVTIRRLELGDYLLNNRVLIERKTIADFATSIADGRLFSQACRMTEGNHIPALIVEGSTKEQRPSGMKREAIQGAMISLILFLGIPCLRSRDSQETASLLRFMANQMRRRITKAVYRQGYRPRRTRNRQLFILQGLPGIGPMRAEQLLNAFGTVEGVFTASAEKLALVTGIGQDTAETIRNLIAPPSQGLQEPKGEVQPAHQAVS